MGMGANMSILGLWQWDHSIFDLMQYPSFQDGETVHQLTNEFLNDTFVDLFHKLELWKRFKEVSMSISIVRTATETHGSSTVMTRLP